MTNTPTPRTDAALLRYTGGELVTFPAGLRTTVDADFARQLEQELNEAKLWIEKSNTALGVEHTSGAA